MANGRFLLALCALLCDAEHAPSVAPPSSSLPVAARMSRLPLRFETNRGQWDERVRFSARQGALTLFVTDEGMTLGLAKPKSKSAAVTIKLVGAKPTVPYGEK